MSIDFSIEASKTLQWFAKVLTCKYKYLHILTYKYFRDYMEKPMSYATKRPKENFQCSLLQMIFSIYISLWQISLNLKLVS